MILCTLEQKKQRVFDWVQTCLNIQDKGDLYIYSFTPTERGIDVLYSQYIGPLWSGQKFLTLQNSEIILFESFRK